MQLNDLFGREGVEPAGVMIMRHRPKEPQLRKALPWLASDRPEVYNAYQQTQSGRCEAALPKAKHVASFIGHEAHRAVFVGLYRLEGTSVLQSKKAYWAIEANRELRKLGAKGWLDERAKIIWFDLKLLSFYSDWKGKLIIEWPGPERSWWRWANRNAMPVRAILEESLLDRQMPQWRHLTLTWDELCVIPKSWQDQLRQWRGVYFIMDSSDGKGYVGSAYGKDNILGRWLNYAASGHGGNKDLRKRKPENLRFSILQRVSPDLETDNVIALEASWKDRLHTREFGLNEN